MEDIKTPINNIMEKRPYFNKNIDEKDVDYCYWIDGYEKERLITKMTNDHLRNVLKTIKIMLEATEDYRLNRPVLYHYTEVIMDELKNRKQ